MLNKLRETIRKDLRKLFRWALNEDDSPMPVDSSRYGNSIGSTKVRSDDGLGRGMHFTVYNAIGGKVVQLSDYDPIRDKHSNSLYIITDREDLGEELGQIITRENLTR